MSLIGGEEVEKAFNLHTDSTNDFMYLISIFLDIKVSNFRLSVLEHLWL